MSKIASSVPHHHAGHSRPSKSFTEERMRPHKCIGNWQLTLLAGRGSFTDVYFAKPLGCRPNWPDDYAVKILRDRHAGDEMAIEMLRREVEVASDVSHPHLVAVLESHLSEAPHFLVMPRLKGVSVGQIIQKAGYLSVRQSLWIVRQVAEALSALHNRNWLHGDVKPENVMFSPDGHVTLVDLGFALRRSEAMLTETRAVAGTLNYIAPEVLTSAYCSDQRSDVYSLGITLFYMLTGQLPFEGRDAAELVEAHRERPLPDPRQIQPHIAADVVRLLSQMTAKEPLRRPQSAKEFINAMIPIEVAALKQERAAAG